MVKLQGPWSLRADVYRELAVERQEGETVRDDGGVLLDGTARAPTMEIEPDDLRRRGRRRRHRVDAAVTAVTAWRWLPP